MEVEWVLNSIIRLSLEFIGSRRPVALQRIMSRNDVTALSRETLDIQIANYDSKYFSREPDCPKMSKRAATSLNPSDYDLSEISWSEVFKEAKIQKDNPIAEQ